MVRKYALRRGDAIVGQVRQPREGERKEKFNPMVRIDSVNGVDPESAKSRVEFSHLTPVHPQQRLRLETSPDNLVGRVIDIVDAGRQGPARPDRVAPAQSGKTTILQSVATSITTNNPECHLMVVLVDERPEEVTDFERSVKGEVVASTFDQAPGDHTTVAELAVERAKRLVELGHDVVVLIDGLSRLGRAYNVAGPTSGRTLAGGVDASALTATKRIFGAARCLEDGGSLTILATTLVDSGSSVDEVSGRGVLRHREPGAAAGRRPGGRAGLPGRRPGPVRHPARGRAGRRPGARSPREAAPGADRRPRGGRGGLAGPAPRRPRPTTSC